MLQAGADISADADPLRRAEHLSATGNAYLALRQWDEALAHFERALAICTQAGQPAGAADAVRHIASVHMARGDPQAACAQYEEAVAMYERVGVRVDVALSLNDLGTVRSNLGEVLEAVAHYERAIGILEQIGAPGPLTTVLQNLGNARTKLGQHEEALSCFERATELGVSPTQRDIAGVKLYNLALTLRAEGELRLALVALRRVIAIEEELDHPDLKDDRSLLASLEAELRAQG